MMLLFYFLVTASHFFVTSHGATDAEILVNFKNSLSTNSLLYDWNVSGIPPCTGSNDNWVGLRCNNDSTIDKLLLENMGLKGTIDIDILMQLPTLRTLSFINNSFEGPMPEVKKLSSLRNLYLSNNNFSGKIDKDAFDGMSSLKEVYLAHNEFTGEIPRSLVLVQKLTKLSLEGNQFDGNLPDFPQENLTVFNAAGNNFKGQIPTSLADFSPSSFAG
jgi:Leucine-rich repeat (LRR) protein